MRLARFVIASRIPRVLEGRKSRRGAWRGLGLSPVAAAIVHEEAVGNDLLKNRRCVPMPPRRRGIRGHERGHEERYGMAGEDGDQRGQEQRGREIAARSEAGA